MSDRTRTAIWFACLAISVFAGAAVYGQPCDPAWDVGLGQPGINGEVYALTVFNNVLYAGGSFTTAGVGAASNMARWNGTSWSGVGSGTSGVVYALTATDSASAVGPGLYAGGGFASAGGVGASNIAAWTGTVWDNLGDGTNATVQAVALFNDGGGMGLYAGGSFTTAGGSIANRIAKWNGTTWSPLIDGIYNGIAGTVFALAAVQDPPLGPALYAGGNFIDAAGLNQGDYIVKWNGTSWSALGSGLDGQVLALVIHDDGSGPALYAGGQFTHAGAVEVNRVAKWDGSTWSAVGTGTDDRVLALASFDDGDGPALYAGGRFTMAGGSAANYLARWNGTQWSSVDSGLNWWGHAFTASALQGAPSLYIAGAYTTAGGSAANHIARWVGCDVELWGDYDEDGDVDRDDYRLFELCLNGPDAYPGPPPPPPPTPQQCLDAFNADGDFDVDLGDFQAFQEAYTG